MVELFTDGASSKNGNGGWAFVAVYDDLEVWREAGGVTSTTNQQMELAAVIRALEWAPRGVPVEVVSDSAYVVNCFVEAWFEKWERSGWQKGGRGGPVANRQLWERLLRAWRARSAATSWRHVRGHQGDRWNERADSLAVDAKHALPAPLPSPDVESMSDVASSIV